MSVPPIPANTAPPAMTWSTVSLARALQDIVADSARKVGLQNRHPSLCDMHSINSD